MFNSEAREIYGDLLERLENAFNSSLEQYLASRLKFHIKQNIYDVYQPKPGAWVNGTTYKRRSVLERNIWHEVNVDATKCTVSLSITSIGQPNKSIIFGMNPNSPGSGYDYPGSFLEMLAANKGHHGILPRDNGANRSRNAILGRHGLQREIDRELKNGGAIFNRIQNIINK